MTVTKRLYNTCERKHLTGARVQFQELVYYHHSEERGYTQAQRFWETWEAHK